MKIADREINLKSSLVYYGFNGLIILDMILIISAIIFHLPKHVLIGIQYFDLMICIMLLTEYGLALYHAPSKKDFVLKPLNIVGLIASIPYDFILFTIIPGSGLLRFFKLFELSRILLLPTRVKVVRNFCEKTGTHKIFGVVITIIIIFTLLFDLFGPSYNGFDDFYFVIVTLTTVGYGDVTPITYNEKILAIVLILIGIFVFSAITASMASFLTDRMIEKEDEDIKA